MQTITLDSVFYYDFFFCLSWLRWLVVCPIPWETTALIQIRFTRFEMTVSNRKNITKTFFFETRQETCCWTLCYGMWWNVELLWGRLISPGWNTDMMWMLREKLENDIPCQWTSHHTTYTLKFPQVWKFVIIFLTVNHIKLHFPLKASIDVASVAPRYTNEGCSSLTCWEQGGMACSYFLLI